MQKPTGTNTEGKKKNKAPTRRPVKHKSAQNQQGSTSVSSAGTQSADFDTSTLARYNDIGQYNKDFARSLIEARGPLESLELSVGDQQSSLAADPETLKIAEAEREEEQAWIGSSAFVEAHSRRIELFQPMLEAAQAQLDSDLANRVSEELAAKAEREAQQAARDAEDAHEQAML